MQGKCKLTTIYHYIRIFFELLCIFFILKDVTGVPASVGQILLVNTLLVLMFYALNYLGKEKMLIIVGALIVISIGLCIWIGKGFRIFEQIFQYAITWNTIPEQRSLIYESLILIIIALLSYCICSFLNQYFIGGMILPAAALITIFAMTMKSYSVSAASGALTMLLVWNVVYTLFGKHKKSKQALFYLPLGVVLFLLLFRLPVEQEPYQWPITHSILNRAENVIYSISSRIGLWGENSENSFAGYGDDGIFGGNLNGNDTIQMEIRGTRTHGNFYMRGRYFNYCDDKRWDSSIPSGKEDAEEMLDWLNALWRNDVTEDEMELFMNALQYEILYKDIKTDTAFGTLGMMPSTTYAWEDGKMCSDDIFRDGDHYGIRFFEVNYQSETFKRIMENPDTTLASYDELATCAKELLGIALYDIVTPEEYVIYCQNRENMIKSNYLALPEEMSERVQSLADELTADCTNDYEKMQVIVDYVRTYNYTTSIADAYQNSDCIADTFLFEEKQGYCVHFATTAALLGRCCNIPTRYVSGYLVNFSNSSENNLYDINGNSAHAWIEAYIKGYGWVRFEPTPAYPNEDALVWVRHVESSDDDIMDVEIDEDAEAKRAAAALAAQQMMQELQEQAEREEREANERALIIRTFLLPVILVIVFALLLKMPLQILVHLREYKKATHTGALEKRLQLFDRISSRGKTKRKDEETLLEYVERNWSNQKQAVQFANQYQKMRYGEMQISEKALSELDHLLKQMEDLLADGNRWLRLKIWVWVWK